MPSYNANINVTVSGQNRLDYVVASVEKLNTIVSRLKPINLLAPGAGEGGDEIRKAKKQLDDFARAVVNFEPQGIQKRAKELSNTLAGSAAQADALGVALANVGLKSGGFKQQVAEVRNYALALEAANRNTERLSTISRSVQRGARLETIAERFGTTPEAVEQRINNIRDIRYKKQRQAAAEEYMQQKRSEDFELRLNKIREKRAQAEQTQGRQKEAMSNAIIGGAFPLLFGQGIGAAVGGGLGGAAGGMMGGQLGFGLSLVGTVLGQQLDMASAKATDFAKSLKQSGDAAGFLKTNLGGLNPETLSLISNLQQSGQTAEAAKVAFNELAKAIGKDNAQALQKAGDDANEYKNIIDRLALAFVAAGYRVNEFFDKIVNNPLNEEKTFTEKAIENLFPSTAGPADTETQEATQRVQILGKETDILRTQATLSTLSAKNSLDKFMVYSKLLATQEYLKTQAEIEYKFKVGSVSKEERMLLLTQARLQLQVNLNNTERQRIEEDRRRQEERQQKIEASYRAENQAIREVYAAQKTYNDFVIQQTELRDGPTKAIERQINTLDDMKAKDIQILNIERNQALNEAQKTGTVDVVNELYNQRLKNLNAQYAVQKDQYTLEYNRLTLEKQLAAQTRTESVRSAVDPIRQQQAQTELGIRSFTQPKDVVEAEKLALDQRLRAYNAELPVLTEIERLNTQIASGRFNDEAKQAKIKDLEAQKYKLAAIKEELLLLDHLEQKQLKLQQIFTEYGQLIQSVSGEIANAVTFGVSEMVRGTKTAEQVFADFLQAIGNALIQQAQVMIATYIAIGIARIFAGMGGGSTTSSTGPNPGGIPSTGNVTAPNVNGVDIGASANVAAKGAYFSNGVAAFASGGIVTSPTLFRFADGGTNQTGLMGEAGPEAIMPLRRNSDGRLGVDASGLRDAMGTAPGSAGGSPVLNMSFETSTINGVEYVSRDQLEAAMAQTRRQAARDGASRGMSMTLDKLQQSPSTRKRVGF